MVLDSHRGKVDFIMDPVAKAMIKVHPNYISFMAIILAAAAGVMLYFSFDHWVLLPISAVVVLVSGLPGRTGWQGCPPGRHRRPPRGLPGPRPRSIRGHADDRRRRGKRLVLARTWA